VSRNLLAPTRSCSTHCTRIDHERTEEVTMNTTTDTNTDRMGSPRALACPFVDTRFAGRPVRR